MATTTFANESDITDEWLTYISNEAISLSRLGNFEIENYADREILNPQFGAALDLIPEGELSLIEKNEPLKLSFFESRSADLLFLRRIRLRRAKARMRAVLCRILSALEEVEVIDWKVIIKNVLLALAGAFFGGALGVILLPILVSLIAMIIKNGLESVCSI